MRQPFAQQQIESGWREKAKVAIGRGDEDAYRLANVNLRVFQVLGLARAQQWKQLEKPGRLQSMTIAELSIVNDESVQELISHAAQGFDSHTRRASR